MNRVPARRYAALCIIFLPGLIRPCGAAKPVAQVWSELKDGRIVVVSPDSPATLAGWLQPALGRVPVRFAPPQQWQAQPGVAKGEQVLLLCQRDQLQSWPAELLAQFPSDPRQVPADEVLVCCKQSWGTWATAVIAPNARQLAEGLRALLATDSALYNTQPLRLVSWKVLSGFAVGPRELAERYFHALQGTYTRVEPKVVDADRFDGRVPPDAAAFLVMVTYQRWRTWPAEVREALKLVLPNEALSALEGTNDCRLVTAQSRTGTRSLAAVVAPDERFFETVVMPDAAKRGATASWTDLDHLTRAKLDNAECPGGACDLKDLRSFKTVVLLAASVDGRLQNATADFVYKVRQNLAEAGHFRFIDEQALEASVKRLVLEEAYGAGKPVTIPGVDAILRLRLHGVGSRTEYQPGAQKRLTERPAPFNKAEPTKPNPDARQYVFAGPKVYPEGVNDPKYKAALQQYDSDYRDWERNRNEYYARLTAADVNWEQRMAVTESATVDGALEVFGRDSVLLCTVPVRSRAENRQEETRRMTVRGFDAEPASWTPPQNRDSAPEGLIRQAMDLAARETVEHLRYSALMPSDGGAAPAPAQPEQPKQPTRQVQPGQPVQPVAETTQAGAAGGPAVVKVTGTAPVEGDVDQAKVIARNDACRLAVEQVIGTYVESATVVEKYELLQDRILTRSTGFARVLREVTQERDGDKLKLTCEVQVEHKPLRDQLVGMGLARQWRVMIVVPEQHLRRQVPDPAAENALMRLFIQSGLPVIDKAHSEELRQNKDMLLQIQGNADLARKLKLKYNAEILVVGEAFSQDVDPIAGQSACRARLEIKAIDLNTAEILAAEDEHATGTDQTSELAGKVALRKAAEEVGERFIDMIYRRPMPTAGGARVEITITGFDRFTQAASFKKALAKLSGVSNVRQLEFTQGVLKVEVEIRQENVEELPAELESNEAMVEFKLRVEQVTTGTIAASVAK